MKNFILLFVVCTFSLVHLHGQTSQKIFDLKIRSGITLANQYGSNLGSEAFIFGLPDRPFTSAIASNGLLSGFNVGSSIEYRINNNFSLGVGVNFIQKGSKINSVKSTVDVNGEIKWRQNYLTFDLPLKLFIPLKQNEFFLQGGLAIGYLISSKEKGSYEFLGNQYNYTNERTAPKNEQGFLVGIGYNYQLSKANSFLTIEFLWNRTLGKSQEYINLVSGVVYRNNQTFNFNIGYSFSFKSRRTSHN